MFVVFEGIDGSGKTTISNRVAKKLRKRGIGVEHVREGGEFSSPFMRAIREFGKDKRNLELLPLSELLLYAAREAQLLNDTVRPALAACDVVFADRYLASYEVLACDGRGLSAASVRPILDAVADGLWPDLTVLINVDPHVARARKRVGKIRERADGRGKEGTGSRKGLGGVGVQHRLYRGYLELARRQPDRWLVVDNTDADLDATVARIVDAVAAVHAGTPVPQVTEAGRGKDRAPLLATVSPTLADAERAFFRFVEERARTEPHTAAYFLSGMDDDRAHEWRDRLAEEAASVLAYGLRGLGDERSWAFRRRLASRAPHFVARSLDGLAVEGPRAEAMRLEFVAAEPEAVLATVDGNDSPAAWAIRRQLAERFPDAALTTVKRIDSAEAWALRVAHLDRVGGEGGLADPAAAGPLADSLRGLGGERAWQLRRACFAASPTVVLWSLSDLVDDEAWAWRARWAERAPKVVLRTFDGSEDPRAWDLRRAHGQRVKETIDSIVGLDSQEAWRLREACADAWPSTVVKTTVPLAAHPRSVPLCLRQLARHPSDLSLCKHATRLLAATR
jgi:dTMP kinase